MVVNWTSRSFYQRAESNFYWALTKIIKERIKVSHLNEINTHTSHLLRALSALCTTSESEKSVQLFPAQTQSHIGFTRHSNDLHIEHGWLFSAENCTKFCSALCVLISSNYALENGNFSKTMQKIEGWRWFLQSMGYGKKAISVVFISIIAGWESKIYLHYLFHKN